MEQRIYKKDSSGKIRYLSISTEGNMVVQESGVVGTNSPVYNRSACEAKNVGRSNSTTPAEQAVLEANSKITEKMRLGYFTSIEEAQEKGGKDFLLPMLAKDFKKEVKKVTFPCYVQPKLDGMRSLGSEDDGFMSRTGKAIDTLGHIVLADLEDVVLDGELYAHGISFQENMKLIKKYRPHLTEQVKYHVYDIVMDAPFNQRVATLQELVAKMNNPHIELVPTYLVTNENQIKMYHADFISQGYEGTMVRHSEEGYAVNKRSSQLLKYKDFLDEVYTVNEVWPSESRPEQGVVECVTPQGVTFTCGMKFSHADREEILINKENYIGKKANIRFFEYTDSGLPRFPVCYGFYHSLDR
jgi:DNA ligase-1